MKNSADTFKHLAGMKSNQQNRKMRWRKPLHVSVRKSVNTGKIRQCENKANEVHFSLGKEYSGVLNNIR